MYIVKSSFWSQKKLKILMYIASFLTISLVLMTVFLNSLYDLETHVVITLLALAFVSMKIVHFSGDAIIAKQKTSRNRN